LAESRLGISSRRPLPKWSSHPWRESEANGALGPGDAFPAVALFVDTFTRWFEPEVARAALDVLSQTRQTSGGVRAKGRPLCCGRTYLSAGLLDEAREEGHRVIDAMLPYAANGIPVVGLEPSCVYTIKEDLPRLIPTEDARRVADNMILFEEAIDADLESGITLPFVEQNGSAKVHGHCHQKAAGSADVTARLLNRIPGFDAELIESGCCGMAGAFGYHEEHYEVSMAIGELDVLPAVREAGPDVAIVAAGTSCRAQITDGTGREAKHPAEIIRDALQKQIEP